MKLPRIIMAVFVAAAITGCVSVTPRDLEGEQGSRFSVEIASAPAATYRRLVSSLRECYSDKAFKVDADFFPDVQRGRVTLGVNAVSLAMVVVNLEPSAEDGTLMRVDYYDPLKRKDSDQQWRQTLVPWAHGLPGFCILDEFKKPAPPDRSRTGG